jgi:hypothetical protein
MGTILAAVVTALLAASVAAAAAPPSPPTAAGWPKTVPAGTVLQGPSGGMVLVGPRGDSFTASAFRRDARRLWTVSQEAGCGNCDDGPQPVLLQPDGTYGPIGYDGDYTWAVDAAGATVRPCAGVVFTDGFCVAAFGEFTVPPAPPGERPVIVGRDAAAATPSWRIIVPGWFWSDDFNVPPMTVRDGAGVVYTAFAYPRRESAPLTWVPSGLLVAVDPVARRILWTAEGPLQAVVGLPSGVLAAEPGGIAAYRGDGSVAWRRAVPEGQYLAPASVVHDVDRGRLYLGRLGIEERSPRGVTAVLAATGAQLWRTRPADRARLLSVGRGGRVYLAIDRARAVAARAVRGSDGVPVWERRTRLPVQGGRELVNGTVAISAGDRSGIGPGVLTLLDPR